MSEERARSDEELATAARNGDAAAFDRLVQRYLRPAMALAWQYTRSVPDAEDVVQEGFHRAIRALGDYDPRRPFRAWFYAIVRNVARTAIGKHARRAALTPLTSLGPEPPARRSRDPVLAEDIGRALESLPPMQQACVRLCDVEGFTSVEAGSMLGIAEGTVRTHLHRARRQLRSAVAPERGTLP